MNMEMLQKLKTYMQGWFAFQECREHCFSWVEEEKLRPGFEAIWDLISLPGEERADVVMRRGDKWVEGENVR